MNVAETHDPKGAPSAPAGRLRESRILKIGPLFMSAALFMSMVFSVFAPLPFLLLWFADRKPLFWIALCTNSAIVYWAGGMGTLGIYAVLVVGAAVFLSFLLPAFKKPDTAGFLALGGMLALAVTGILIIQSQDQSFLHTARDEFWRVIEQMQKTSNPSMDALTLQSVQRKVWVELPSALGMLALFMVWGNIMLLFRLNPGRVREKLGIGPQYFRYWKAPEVLIWPTLICAAVMLLDQGRPSEIAFNVLKVLMGVWAIQGFAVFGFLLDRWHVSGFFRSIAYVFMALSLMPLVIGIGFFDQWFDFRSKFRQS